MRDFPSKAQLQFLRETNRTYPEHLVRIPVEDFPPDFALAKRPPVELWRSRKFLVQVFAEKSAVERLTVCRTQITGKTWLPGISWDELQQLKRECGRGEVWAVEIFPPESELVNVENMRHLFVTYDAPTFAWRRKES